MPSTNWSWAADADVQMPSISATAISASENGHNAAHADDKDIRSRCSAFAAGRQHLPDVIQTCSFAAAFSLPGML